MTFFGIVRGSPTGIFFILISLLNVYYGLRVGRTLWQHRAAVRQEPLRPGYKRLLDQAAFFVAIPPGVLIHELFHALPILAFGGRVLDVGYAFYFGYVAHVGLSDEQQLWFVALAGTLGTLIYALGLYFALRRSPVSAYRYFALRSLRVHVFYALIFYPLFSAFTFIGDWRTIYDFGRTPLLSGVTLGVHLGLLALYWLGQRRGFFDMPAFDSPEQQRELLEIERQALANPQDLQASLRLADAYRRAGLRSQARRQLLRFLELNPNSADGHLQMALLEAQDQHRVPARAQHEAQEALRLGLSNPSAVAYAHQLIGQRHLEMERVREAAGHFRLGLEAAAGDGNDALEAQMGYFCAVALRRQGQYDRARDHIDRSIRWAQAAGNEQAEARFRTELETIEGHAGRPTGGPRAR
jgi:tetratricopeptide (TPR) repeat protein